VDFCRLYKSKKNKFTDKFKKIFLNAFENCSSLNSLEIPEGVEKF